MKLNKKGFMMAEVVVVSSVVLIILTTLFISYNKIFSLYESRLSYEDTNLLYALAYYRDYLITNNQLELQKSEMESSGKYYDLLTYRYKPLETAKERLNNAFDPPKNELDNVYLVHNGGENLNMTHFGNAAFIEYIEYLEGVDLTDTEYILILERKFIDTGVSKYAYLALED
jgi:hypothetical protein